MACFSHLVCKGIWIGYDWDGISATSIVLILIL